jgi:O-antigen ligase
MLAPLLLFAATTCSAIAFSSHRDLSLLRASYTPVSFLIFFAVQDALVENGALRRIGLVLSGLLFLIGLNGLVQVATGETLFGSKPMYSERVVSSLPHPNDLAIVVLIVPFVIALGAAERSVLVRAFVALSLLVAIPTAIASQSRNVWLGMSVAIFAMLALARDRRPVFVLCGLAAVIVAAATQLDASNFESRLATLGHFSQDGRIGIWLAGWEMFKDEPISGVGLHVFKEAYAIYLERTVLPAGYHPELAAVPWAHNLYIEMLAERGIVGLAGFLAPVLAMVHCLRGALGPDVDERYRPYAVGLAASLAAFLTMGLFDLTFLKDWVQLMFWLIVGMSVRLETLAVSPGAGSPLPAE